MDKELTTKEIQGVILEILKAVTDICEEQSYRYMLIFGTLLGAVRHHGFIPWDDDIDIMMPRKDHDKFVEYFKNNREKYPHFHLFIYTDCPDYPYMVTRVSDDRYKIIMKNEKDYGMGLFIDIYPFDGIGNTWKEASLRARKGDFLSSVCFQATRKHFAIETTTSKFRKLIKFPFFIFSKIYGKKRAIKILHKMAGIHSYETSKYVGCIIWLSGYKRDCFLRRWFEESIKVAFEQYEFRIPREYNKVLEHDYGDYMQLPPEKDRVGNHNYKAYIK